MFSFTSHNFSQMETGGWQVGHCGCRQDANSDRSGFYVVLLTPPGREDRNCKGLAAEKAPVLSGKSAGSGFHVFTS